MKNLIKNLLAATAAVSIVASAAIAGDTPKRGGTLIAALGNTPRVLNPAVQSGIVTGFQAHNYLRHLYGMMKIGRHNHIWQKVGTYQMMD